MSSRNGEWLLLWWQERARDSQRHSRQADCHLWFAWDFRPHPLCAGDRVQQPSSSHQKWNPAEEKRENTGLKETAKTPNLSRQPELIVNAGKVKLCHRLQQPGFAHCLFSHVPPDALPPTMRSSPGGGFRPQLWVVSFCSYSFRSVPTASLHHRCYLLFCIYALRKTLPCWHREKHQWVKPVIQAAKPSGLSAEKVGHGFRQDFYHVWQGKEILNALPSSKVGVRYFFSPCQLQSKAKKPRWQTKRVEDEDAHLQRGVVKGNGVQITTTKNKIN